MNATTKTIAEEFGFSGDDAKRITDLGCDLIDSGDFEGAASIFESLLVLNPKDTSTRAALGSVLEELGQFDKAETLYSEAISGDSNCELARLNRGQMRLRRGDKSGIDDLKVIASRKTGCGTSASKLLAAQR